MASADSSRAVAPVVSRSKAWTSSSRITRKDSGSSRSARRTHSRSTANSPIWRAPGVGLLDRGQERRSFPFVAPGFVSNRGEWIVEPPGSHPMNDQFLHVCGATCGVNPLSHSHLILPLENPQLVFPVTFSNQKPHLPRQFFVPANRTLVHP